MFVFIFAISANKQICILVSIFVYLHFELEMNSWLNKYEIPVIDISEVKYNNYLHLYNFFYLNININMNLKILHVIHYQFWWNEKALLYIHFRYFILLTILRKLTLGFQNFVGKVSRYKSLLFAPGNQSNDLFSFFVYG